MNIWAAFFLGLAGSLHCAAMCGPLVLALSLRKSGKSWPWLYHTGRIVTYMLLGLISGAAGSVLIRAGWQRWLSILAGGLMLAALAVKGRGPATWLKGRFGPLLQSSSPAATAGLGALNGLLPCGLVYLAAAAATATGSVAGGLTTMLAFGVGTAPMMLGIHLAGRGFSRVGPARLRRVALTCAAVAGGWLILRGLSLGIPYVSPAGGGACCGAVSLTPSR